MNSMTEGWTLDVSFFLILCLRYRLWSPVVTWRMTCWMLFVCVRPFPRAVFIAFLIITYSYCFLAPNAASAVVAIARESIVVMRCGIFIFILYFSINLLYIEMFSPPQPPHLGWSMSSRHVVATWLTQKVDVLLQRLSGISHNVARINSFPVDEHRWIRQ